MTNDINNNNDSINLSSAIERHGAATQPTGPGGSMVYDIVQEAIAEEFILKTNTLLPAPLENAVYNKLRQVGEMSSQKTLKRFAVRFTHEAFRQWALQTAVKKGCFVQYRWEPGKHQLSFRGAFGAKEVGRPNCQTAKSAETVNQLVRDARIKGFRISWGPRVDGDLIRM